MFLDHLIVHRAIYPVKMSDVGLMFFDVIQIIQEQENFFRDFYVLVSGTKELSAKARPRDYRGQMGHTSRCC
jgi:hypothetical protein